MRVPSYHQEVLDTVTRVVRKAISDVLIPSGFQSWLKKIVNSIASPSPSVASLAKVSRGTAQHRVADYLQAAQNEVPFATWKPVDDHTGAWLLRLPDSPESPFPALWSFIEQRVRIDVTGQHCDCPQLFDSFPVLRNSTGHIILRSTKQWTSLLGESLGSTLACNARNRVFRSPASLTNSFESFIESLQNIKCPSFQPGEGSFSKLERLLPDDRVQVLLNDIASVTWDDISQPVSKCQWLDESLGLEARDWLWWHKFCGGIWDKKAHRNYAVCRVLDDIRTCDGILFGKRFTLAGWGPTPRDAQATDG